MDKQENYEYNKWELRNHIRNSKGEKKFRLANKKTSNLFRKRDDNDKRIKITNPFDQVLKIDEKNNIAEVEGSITYENLVRETLSHGLLPNVVPELKSITVGGAYAGGGVESSSFKYGFVHQTIPEAEVLTGTGDVIKISEQENSDLFYGFPNSYGSLGYALKINLPLVKAKKNVIIEHQIYDNPEEFFDEIAIESSKVNLNDFVEGVIFDENRHVITKGTFTDLDQKTSNYKHMNIYYKSLLEKEVDLLSTEDYIWRWDTDWFWCSREQGIKNFNFENPLVRLVAGPRFLNSKSYQKVMRFVKNTNIGNYLGLKNKESVIQDVEIPIEKAKEFYDIYMDEIPLKPIWVCPSKSPNNNNYTLFNTDNDKLYLNFGFWGFVNNEGNEEEHHNKRIEDVVKELGGKRSLYSKSFYSEPDFWEIYGGEKYHTLKARYDPNNNFPNLYEKAVLQE